MTPGEKGPMDKIRSPPKCNGTVDFAFSDTIEFPPLPPSPSKALPTGTNVNEWVIQNFMRPFLHHDQQLDPTLCILSWYQSCKD